MAKVFQRSMKHRQASFKGEWGSSASLIFYKRQGQEFTYPCHDLDLQETLPLICSLLVPLMVLFLYQLIIKLYLPAWEAQSQGHGISCSSSSRRHTSPVDFASWQSHSVASSAKHA
ncbi:hypothetical protein FGO68_gene11299 [Halteria grandinella]|uniref:Uncharacterized protein n=1 Tax=Halteria grandinella TaxID=5974 RepID=A0A8J8T1F0_HALGN|nr:hypothetical protein FGO68_gene11299 [Halteria grandinella]